MSEKLESAPEAGVAGRSVDNIFGSDAQARATAELISRFVNAWEQRDPDVPPDRWLTDELRQWHNGWAGEAEIRRTAREILSSIERANANKESLYAHLSAGKSRASWLAGSIEQGAAAAGTANVGAYAGNIESALKTANDLMEKVVQTQGGAVSQQPNLDGFIAEQHHASTFNIDAATKGIPYRAKVLGSSRKNSVDIGIYDGNGKLVRRYQSKYGSDAGATEAYLKRGDYRGQRKLVPEGQAQKLEGATETLEYGDVRSKPLSKERAKDFQGQAQSNNEARRYDWNDVNRIEVAKTIGRQALMSAAVSTGFQGARIAARRAWTYAVGKENPPASKDMREFFESATHSAGQAGVQVAVTGAIVLAVKKGWIKALQNTPAGRIANAVYVGMENAKVLWKLSRGELTPEQALDAMGNTTCTAIGALVGAAKGAALGASVGTVFGPPGSVIGGFVGGVAGGIAGSKIGEAVYESAKVVAKTAVKAVAVWREGAQDMTKAVDRVFNPLKLPS